MKFEKWNLPVSPPSPEALEQAGYPHLLSCVLAAHGITDEAQADAFLKIEEHLPYSPLLMADMDRAVCRIRQAIDSGEHIAVFGDYDVDGITATVIAVDYLLSCGAEVSHYIPRRIEDGYGLSKDAIATLHSRGVKLIVTVDCGITGVEEVDYAASLGIDVVVTDHHECKDKLPRAVAVVNPHRSDCTYPFKHLAGCGVALKLVLALGGEVQEDALLSRYCTLAAIGTVADVMLMTGENRAIVARGLAGINRPEFIGLQALLKEAGLSEREVTSVQIGFVLSPRLNAAGRMGEADKAADLLLSRDPIQAAHLAQELCELNRLRQNVEQEIYAQTLEMIVRLPDDERHALVLADAQWHQGVVGIVASRLSEKFACPSFMIHLSGETGKGSCRSWGGFNLFAALEECSDLLLGFGGHELAAGFTIEADQIPAFRRRMNECVMRYRHGQPAVSALDVDVILRQPTKITLQEIDSLRRLEPYGSGNSRPLFCLLGATLERVQNVGQNRHLKVRISKGNTHLEGIFFSATAEQCGCEAGSRIDIAFYLQINEFRGIRSAQMQVVDLRPSLQCSAREEESLQLLHRLTDGETLPPKDALRLLPSRQQCVAAWRLLEHELSGAELDTHYLPFLRRIAAGMPGTEPFLRACFCMALFAERGLVQKKICGDSLHLQLCSLQEKVDLKRSPYWVSLQCSVSGRR